MKNTPFDPATVARVASDTLTVRRVFGEPYTANGVTIIPVAKVWGGAGGGAGQDERPARDGTDSVESAGAPDGAVETDPDEAADVPDDVASHRAFGGGSGFGVRVHALGVYVVDDSGVHWRPAIDVNRAILGCQILGSFAAICVARSLLRRR